MKRSGGCKSSVSCSIQINKAAIDRQLGYYSETRGGVNIYEAAGKQAQIRSLQQAGNGPYTNSTIAAECEVGHTGVESV